MARGASYVLIFGLVALLASALGLTLGLGWSLTKCDHRFATADAFLAECNAFGNYEHGAYYYALEPEAVANLKRADVLFLGNSHLQYAFSNATTDAFFQARGLRHYLLGFGYNEGSAFFAALASHLGLHPRAVIINADPFFSGNQGFPAHEILGLRGPVTWFEYTVKARALAWEHALCGRFAWDCGGHSPTIYRARQNGHWLLEGYNTGREAPLQAGAIVPTPALLDKAAQRGRDALAQIGTDPACVILTGIPGGRAEVDEGAIANGLSQRMGVRVLNVVLPDMRSIDGSHMTRETAERWSAAFFEQLAPLLAGCGALVPAAQPADARNPLDPPAVAP